MIILLCIFLVDAASDLDIELTKTQYSGGENFQGNIIINESNVDITKLVKGKVTSCGSYDEKEISLYQLLTDSGLYSGSEYDFSLSGDGVESIQKSIGSGGSAIVGLYIEDKVDEINFSISGSGSELYIDVGADDSEDWHYTGEFTSWGDLIYPAEYEGSDDYSSGVVSSDVQYGVYNEVNLSFDDLSDTLLLRVEAVAKKNADAGGSLSVEVGSERCILEGVGTDWTEVGCDLVLDTGDYDNPDMFRIYIDSDIEGYFVPKRPGSDYYFIRSRKALFDENIKSEKVYISDSGLRSAINDYYKECSGSTCVIPLELKLGSAGTLNLADLVLKYGNDQSPLFYNIASTSTKLNLTDELIPLSDFSELKVPDIEEDTCGLEISFDGSEEEVFFNVSSGPTPIIDVSSLYMGKDLPIIFDGSDSSARDNKSIVNWKWDFGDNETDFREIVSHSYNKNGNYTVTLTVKDSEGVESSTNVLIHIVPLEEHLTYEFGRMDGLFEDSKEFFGDLTEDLKDFHVFMGYSNIIKTNEDKINDLEANFTSVKEGDSSDKDLEYAEIAGELYSLKGKTPLSIHRLGGKIVKHLTITGPDEVFKFDGISDVKYSNAYAKAIYSFNRDNVKVDMDSDLFDVNFFEGDSDYVFVRKEVTVVGGSNLLVVEDLRKTVSNLDNVFSNGVKDESTGVIYWELVGSSLDIEYSVETSDLSEIKTIVYSDVEVVETESSDGSYVGPIREDSVFRYVLLFGLFFLLVLYLLFYKGPGNFKDLTNKISYGLIHRKLFVSDRDKLVLRSFIVNALNRGFSIPQIKSALLKKGWSKHQVDHILENYIKRKR